MKPFCFGLVFLLGAIVLSSAAEMRFENGPQQTALVELYTSEGCSSCPPAEAWLGRLKIDPGLWKGYVQGAFHAHYWDNLGWTARVERKDFTARQHTYANAWRASSVYTPCFVRDGQEWTDWRHSSMPA